VVDESGENHLFYEKQFVFIELPEASQDALQLAQTDLNLNQLK